MKNRSIPFGYQIQEGITQLHTSESKVVNQIYTSYLDGLSLKDIAEILTKDKVEFLPGIYDWNKNRVKRIIEDDRYLGSDTYPLIINNDMYEQSQMLKYMRNTQKHINQAIHATMIDTPLICPECGEELKRIHDHRKKISELWRCNNATCDFKTKINDCDLLKAITEALNLAIDNTSLIEPDASQDGCYPSLDVKRLSNEISRTLEGFDFDKEQLKNMIFECAAEKYRHIKSARHITDILKNEFARQTRCSTFNKELFDKTVSQIKLKKDNSVCLILKNDQIIGKELISHDTDSDYGTSKNS